MVLSTVERLPHSKASASPLTIERTPRRSNKRVRETTDSGDDRRPAIAAAVEHHQGCQETDDCTAGNIARVVQADEDASQSDCCRAEEVDESDSPSADKEHREGDREGGYSVVARKRRLIRGSREKQRLRWMGDKRSFPHPDM
jgi:hypothetical protein